MNKTSHRERNMEFRPVCHHPKRARDGFALWLRFARQYLKPYRRLIALSALLISLDSCGSFYLIAYYSRVVVDSILMVRPAETPGSVQIVMRHAPPSVGSRSRAQASADPVSEMGFRHHIESGAADSGRPLRAERKLAGLFVLYIITILVGNVIRRVAARNRIRVGRSVTRNLRDDMHGHVIRLSLSSQTAHTPGRLMARILSDVEMVQEHMLMLILDVSSNVIMVLTGLIMLYFIDWRMALMVLVVMPLYVVVHKLARPELIRSHREMRHTNSCLYGLSSQKLDAIRLIQSSGREKREKLVFHRLIACFFRDGLRFARIGATTDMFGQFISVFATNGIVFVFGIHQVLNGDITLGQMLYAYGAAASLFMPVLALSRMNNVFAHLVVSLQRLAEIMDEPNPIKDPPSPQSINWPLKKGVVVSQLSFRYDSEAPAVLRDVSFTVPAGEWMCIMGASGSGKTTLLYLLSRLLDSDKGDILFDGISIKNISLANMRRDVVLVPQEPQILSGTIRENVCYGRPMAEPSEIMRAARDAEFHDFVMSLPVKYETLLGEKGTSLSGGQKQRLSLARALLTRPEALLLDDCTSALDAETEHRIQLTLTSVLKKKTAVIVSQRVSMAQRCSRICVLDKGVISESGTPAELLERGGFYARLYAQQTGNVPTQK